MRCRMLTGASPDPRCSHALLHDQSWTPPTAPDRSPPRAPPRAGDAKVHRRHRGGRVPVQPHPGVQHKRQQPDELAGRCGGVPDPGPADGAAWEQGPGQGRAAGDSEGGVRRWWAGWEPESDGADDGGSGDGGRGVWGQCEAQRVLPVRRMWDVHW